MCCTLPLRHLRNFLGLVFWGIFVCLRQLPSPCAFAPAFVPAHAPSLKWYFACICYLFVHCFVLLAFGANTVLAVILFGDIFLAYMVAACCWRLRDLVLLCSENSRRLWLFDIPCWKNFLANFDAAGKLFTDSPKCGKWLLENRPRLP